MNVLKQGATSTISAYLGTIIGMFNRIALFPLAFMGDSANYWGLIDLYVGTATVLASVGLFGMPKVLPKFLPNNRLNGDRIQNLAFRFFALGALVTTCVVLFLRTWISGRTDMPELFDSYYTFFLFILVAFFMFEWASQKLIATYNSHIPVVFNQLLIRIYIFVALILKWQDVISIDEFIIVISCGYLAIFGLMYLISWRKKVKGVVGAYIEKKEKIEIFVFSTFSIASGSGVWVFGQLDLILVGIVMPFANVAFLGVSKNIINMMAIPTRSISQVLVPVISDLSRNDKTESLEKIYKKSSFSFSFTGVLFLLGIWANIEWVLSFLSSKLEMDQSFRWVILLLGIGKLIEFSTGLSGVIINMSKKFRWSSYFNLLSIVVMVSSGLMFFQLYGLIGIVLAQVLTSLVLNISRIVLLKREYSLWPFTYEHIPVLVILIIGLFTFSVSMTGSIWIDACLRNLMWIIAAPLLMWKFGNDDIKSILNKLLMKVGFDSKMGKNEE